MTTYEIDVKGDGSDVRRIEHDDRGRVTVEGDYFGCVLYSERIARWWFGPLVHSPNVPGPQNTTDDEDYATAKDAILALLKHTDAAVADLNGEGR